MTITNAAADMEKRCSDTRKVRGCAVLQGRLIYQRRRRFRCGGRRRKARVAVIDNPTPGLHRCTLSSAIASSPQDSTRRFRARRRQYISCALATMLPTRPLGPQIYEPHVCTEGGFTMKTPPFKTGAAFRAWPKSSPGTHLCAAGQACSEGLCAPSCWLSSKPCHDAGRLNGGRNHVAVLVGDVK